LSPAEKAIVDAARMVNVVAWYLAIVGLGGLVEEAKGALAIAAGGAAVLGAAWLIRWHQSRVVAGILLVVALAYAITHLRSAPGTPVTGWLVVTAWCFAGGFAVYATFRFHAVKPQVGGLR
jgi:hypothetical protein